jgi:ATPase subunit of ABC transporter with duplicated ATPase domains
VAAASSAVDAGQDAPDGVRFAPAARLAAFSQDNRVELGPGPLLDQLVGSGAFGNGEEARRGLGRYGLADRTRHRLTELSGGQQARIQLLLLERDRPNVLLLDEPTDNLDLDSIAIIEEILAELDATQVAISHDRTFARLFDRWVMFDGDGVVAELPDLETGLALAAIRRVSLVEEANRRRGIKVLTNL